MLAHWRTGEEEERKMRKGEGGGGGGEEKQPQGWREILYASSSRFVASCLRIFFLGSQDYPQSQ